MSGDMQPTFGQREALSIDDLMGQVERIDLDTIERLMDPQGKAELDVAADRIAPFLWALSQQREGRALLDWLADITVRRPFFRAGMSIEQAALYSAHREGQNAVLYTILKVIRTEHEKRTRA